MDFLTIIGYLAPLLVIIITQFLKKIIGTNWAPLVVLLLGGTSALLGVGPAAGGEMIDGAINVAWVSGLGALLYDLYHKLGKKGETNVAKIIPAAKAMIAIFVVAGLFGCGTVADRLTAAKTEVPTYEGTALALNTAKAYIKGQEISGQLQGEKLDAVIAQWELARKIFIEAGEALKASIGAAEPLTQQQKMETYNVLLQKAATEVGKIK